MRSRAGSFGGAGAALADATALADAAATDGAVVTAVTGGAGERRGAATDGGGGARFGSGGALPAQAEAQTAARMSPP